MNRRVVAVAIFLSLPLMALADALPTDIEFQVNTYTTNEQQRAAACRSSAGRTVLIWQSLSQDGDKEGVFGQRYDSLGAPEGGEFQVNTYTVDYQGQPALCCDQSGNFVVVWASEARDGQVLGVFGQRFASGGARLGTEFQVNTYTQYYQFVPAVCCARDGNFTVVWESEDQEGSLNGVFGQRFAGSGAPLGTEFQVNTYTPDNQGKPSVCCSASGDFVAAWSSDQAQDGDDRGVFGQRFASGGTRLGTEFQVNTYTEYSQSDASTCCDAAGNFVVAWTSFEQDGNYRGVFGQRFAGGGTRLGTEFQINTYTEYNQFDASACCDAAGNFVVAWASTEQDGYYQGVFGQRFAGSGARLATEFQVNTYTISDQAEPSIACDGDGDFVIAWQSYTQDGDALGVFAQRFEVSEAPTAAPVLGHTGLAATALALSVVGALALALRRRKVAKH